MEIVNAFLGLLFLAVLILLIFKFIKRKKISTLKSNDNHKIFFDKQLINQEKKSREFEYDNIDPKIITVISSAVAYLYLDNKKTYKINSIKRSFYADDRI